MAILVCLAAVTGGVLFKQASFNPAVFVARDAGISKVTAPANPSPVSKWLPAELKEFGQPETFTPENLYDKIDGKAELYVSSGFVRLNCQRLALAAAPDQWLEWFVYDMGTVPHAFSVFTMQRRADARPLNITEYAYQTQNALYFVSGSNYVEAVASSASEPLMNAVVALARHFAAADSSGGARLTQLELFPSANLVPGSQALQTADVFGFDQFKNVYTAEYSVGNAKVLAFVTSCPSGPAADRLRDGYRAFLVENGGKMIDSSDSEDKPVNLLGDIDLVFSEGPYVAGIHAAPALEPARTIAAQLRQRLKEKLK